MSEGTLISPTADVMLPQVTQVAVLTIYKPPMPDQAEHLITPIACQ